MGVFSIPTQILGNTDRRLAEGGGVMQTPASTEETLELVPLHLKLAPVMVLENTPIGTLMIGAIILGGLISRRGGQRAEQPCMTM